MKRRAAALVAAGMAAVAGFTQGPAPRAQQGGEPLTAAWEREVGEVAGLAIAPEATQVAVIDGDGRIQCFAADGTPRWTAAAPGASRLAMAALGRGLAAYAPASPLQTRIALFGARGVPLAPVDAGGPIMSATLSGGGDELVAGTPAGIRWAWIGRGKRKAGSVPLPGAARQVLPGPARSFYVALRGSGGALRARRDGQILWHAAFAGIQEAVIAPAADGHLVGVAEQLAPDQIRLELRRDDGELAWSAIWPGRLPRLRVLANGAVLVLSYEQPEPHGAATRYEHRVAYFRTDGGPRPRWATGGAYTGASFFAGAAPDGSYVVSLDQEPRSGAMALRLVDAGGAKLARYVARAPIRIAAASEDGTRLAVYRADGMLAMIRIR